MLIIVFDRIRMQYVMSYRYLTWRVLSSLHTNITLHFLVVSHTKFSPDYGAASDQPPGVCLRHAGGCRLIG